METEDYNTPFIPLDDIPNKESDYKNGLAMIACFGYLYTILGFAGFALNVVYMIQDGSLTYYPQIIDENQTALVIASFFLVFVMIIVGMRLDSAKKAQSRSKIRLSFCLIFIIIIDLVILLKLGAFEYIPLLILAIISLFVLYIADKALGEKDKEVEDIEVKG